jgi:acyl-CoA thioester hydrolase
MNSSIALWRRALTTSGSKKATLPHIVDMPRTLHAKTLQELQSFALVTTADVLWGHQDAFGHVNNTRHIQFFEQSRTLYFRHLSAVSGVPFNNESDPSRADAIGPILANLNIKYTAILEWPNVVAVGARVHGYKRNRTRFSMTHKLVVATTGQVVAVGDGDVSVVDYATGKTTTVPLSIQKAIDEFEQRSVPDLD